MNFIHCNSNCGNVHSLSPRTPFFLTACFHVICGPCRNSAISISARCPVCNKEPLQTTELSTQCDGSVKAYFMDPFESLEKSMERTKVYHQFQMSQLKRFTKLMAELSDRNKKLKTESIAFRSGKEMAEKEVAALRKEVQHLKEQIQQMQCSVTQLHRREGNKRVAYDSTDNINPKAAGSGCGTGVYGSGFQSPMNAQVGPNQKLSASQLLRMSPADGMGGRKTYFGLLGANKETPVFVKPSTPYPNRDSSTRHVNVGINVSHNQSDNAPVQPPRWSVGGFPRGDHSVDRRWSPASIASGSMTAMGIGADWMGRSFL